MSVAAVSRASSRTSKLTTPAEDDMLMVTPSTLEVDYDTESTELYKAITQQQWDEAIAVCEADPVQASVWVVRHSQSDESILWRFLPLHSACARQPPLELVRALLSAYPDAAACVDDQGMYALHYAAGNQASLAVLQALVEQCPAAVHIRDPRGMIALHYAACWGPGDSLACVELLITPRTVKARDHDGNTAQDLAEQASYPMRNAVLRALQAESNNSHLVKTSTNKRTARRIVPSVASTSQDSSHESRYDIGGRRFHTVLDRRDQRHGSVSSRSSLSNHVRSNKEVTTVKERSVHSTSSSSKQASTQAKSAQSIHSASSKSDKREAESCVDNNDVALLREQLEKANQEISAKDEEIRVLRAETEAQLVECAELHDAVALAKDEHELTKRKFKETKDRLAGLSVSLESILEQNDMVEETMEMVREMDQARKKALEHLASLPLDINETRLVSSMQKQKREMEAIAAVINAARD